MRALRTLLLAALLGGAVGALSALYLGAVRSLEHLLWDGSEPRLPLEPWLATLVLCTAGGVVVGFVRLRHDRDTPRDLGDALAGLDDVIDAEAEKEQPPPKVTWLLRAAVLGVISLGFGASLGPEAPLLVIATGLGQRVARILRLSQSEAAYISASGALSGLFGGPLGAVVLPVEQSRDARKSASMLVYGVVGAISGLVALVAVLPSEGGLRYDLPSSGGAVGTQVLSTVGWATLAAVPATLAGLLLLLLTGPTLRLAQRIPTTVARATAGGLVLGLCALLTPLALFSGEHQAQDLIDNAGSRTVWALLGLVLVKVVATLVCVSTGWFGGQIFPAAFSGMAAALVVVALLPDARVDAVVAAGAGAGAAALLRRPVAAVLVLLLFFPPTSLLALTVGAAVAAAAAHALADRLPAPQSLGAHQ